MFLPNQDVTSSSIHLFADKYSNIAPEENIISTVNNIISYFDGSSVYLSNQSTIISTNESLTALHEYRMSDIEDSETELSKKKTSDQIAKYITGKYANLYKSIKYDGIIPQIDIILNLDNSNLGLKLCFAAYIKSLPMISSLLLTPHSVKQTRYSKYYATKAIEIMRNYTLPPLFIPNFNVPPFLSIPLNEIEIASKTAIATSSEYIYIGGKQSIYCIPLHKTGSEQILEIPINGQEQNYSLIYLNEFLIYSTPLPNPMCISINSPGTPLPLNVTTKGFYFPTGVQFTSPAVTDGYYIYSVEFGQNPRLKIFQLDPVGMNYIASIPLKSGHSTLKAPFRELLPLKQKDSSVVATNGIFISFIFSIPNSHSSLCRTFRVRDGVHVHDDIIQPPTTINGWTFDLDYPAHCVILDHVAVLIDSNFTLPSWFVGLRMPEQYDIKNILNATESIVTFVSNELWIYASYFIGTNISPIFNFDDILGVNPIEDCICSFIDNSNFMAAQAMLIFLYFITANSTYSLSNNNHSFMDSSDNIFINCMNNQKNAIDNVKMLRFSKILVKFAYCFLTDEFNSFKPQIVFSFLSSFDFFAQVDLEQTVILLLKIIESKVYLTLLFKYLPRSNLLAYTLTEKSLEWLCELSLNADYIHQTEAINLLKHIQYKLVKCRSLLFIRYAKIILDHFNHNLYFLLGEEWSESRFISSVSYNIFKELLMAMLVVQKYYEFPVGLIVDFFTIGNIPYNHESPIQKLLERSLVVAYEIFFSMIKNDKLFYLNYQDLSKLTINPANLMHIFPKLFGKDRKILFNYYGIDIEIQREIQNIYDKSLIFNLEETFIIQEINIILNKIRSGKISKNILIKKIHQINNAQPQLFESISNYLKDEKYDQNSAILDSSSFIFDQSESICAKFINLLTKANSERYPSSSIVFSFYIPQIYNFIEHFLLIPNDSIDIFLSNLKLWFLMRPEILARSNITDKMIISLDTSALLTCEHYLLEYNKYQMFNYPISLNLNEMDLLRTLILLNISQLNISELESYFHNNNIKILELFLHCITTGNYEIIKQILIFILQNIANLDFSIIDKCLEIIGVYLNEEKIIFYYQQDRLKCLQNCFLIADYLREILKKVPHYFKKLFDKKNVESLNLNETLSYSKILGLFLVMNNSFDIPRLYSKMSFLSDNGILISGIITTLNDKNIIIHTDDQFEKLISIKTHSDYSFSGFFTFDPIVLKDYYSDIKNLLVSFQPKIKFHDIFKFGALNEFMSIKDFRSLITEDIISQIANRISETLIPIHKYIYDFYQLMMFHMTSLPIFMFNEASKNIQCDKLTPTVDTIVNSFFNKTKQKDFSNLEISDTLTSFEETTTYVSTPIHPNIPTRITFDISSSNVIEPHLILTIYMLGKTPGTYFVSQSIICDSNSKPSIEIRPRLHSILIQTPSLHDVNIFLQPSCEFIYIAARIASETIVDFKFEYSLNTSTESSTAEISIPRYCSNETEPLPFQISSIFVDAQMQKDTVGIVSHYAMNIISYFPNYSCTYKYISYALLSVNQNPFGNDLDIYQFNNNIIVLEDDFPNIFEISNYKEKIKKFLCFANNALINIKNDEDSLNDYAKYLLIDMEKRKKRYYQSGFGSRNTSASVFSENINGPIPNSYVISNPNIYLNQNQIVNKYNGIIYTISKDDITDSIIEFMVRIKHAASIIIYLSTSNNFLLENIIPLIELINDSSMLCSTSYDAIIKILSKTLPKNILRKVDNLSEQNTESEDSANNTDSNNSKKNKYKARNLYILQVASLNSNFNLYETPIKPKQTETVSKFTYSDDEDLSSILKENSSNETISINTEILALEDWVKIKFPSFFVENTDDINSQIEMFFVLNHSLKCFPLTHFIELILLCTASKAIPNEVDRNILQIRPSESSEDEYLFFLLSDSNTKQNNHIEFEFSYDKSFQMNVFKGESNKPLILPNKSFYFRILNGQNNSYKIMIKSFSMNEQDIYSLINNEVFKWNSCFSHQLLLSYINIIDNYLVNSSNRSGRRLKKSSIELTYEMYNSLPLSSVISYEVASFFFYILQKNPKNVNNHTLNYKIPYGQITKNDKIILSLIPDLAYVSFIEYRPRNSEESSIIISFLCTRPQELPYTIPFTYWKEVCFPNSPSNLIFNNLTQNKEELNPYYLRAFCTKILMSDFSKILDSFIWKGFNKSDERRQWIEAYIKNLPPALIALFVEFVTGHWGSSSFYKSENPYILLQSDLEHPKITIHQDIQTIIIGNYSEKNQLIFDLKSEFNRYLVSTYE